MKYIIPLILLAILFSCRSVPDKVKADKDKYIQVAKETSRPVDINNLNSVTDIYEQAKKNNTEGKLKYLGVDNIQIIYGSRSNSEIELDSIVIFTKRNYLIFYDFAVNQRGDETVKQKNELKDLEKIDNRLFIGKK